jgi:multisubunit Na+/H+ antiporter MnhE subunit
VLRTGYPVAVTLVVWWVALVLVWVASLSSVTWQELAVAGAAAALCVVVAAIARRMVPGRRLPGRAWLGGLWLLPRVVLTETLGVWRMAVRQVRHRPVGNVTRELRLGGERSQVRQATAVLLLAATPGTVVVDVDRRANVVLLHSFAASAGPMERAVRS